jgi:uncharacterized protein
VRILSRRISSRGLTWAGPTDNVHRITERDDMLETIEKLLILQDRDRNIMRVKSQLEQIEPERQALQSKAAGAQATREAARHRVKQLETERNKLELEVEAKKQLIERYSVQQFQTRKNEEYRALAHEIDMCKADIVKLEDHQLELMEQGEVAQQEAVGGAKAAAETRKHVDHQLAELAAREQNLQKELAELEAGRDQLLAAVQDNARARYERLFKHKGGRVVVGVQHGVCGGCHMRLPPQMLIMVQTQQELVTCPNCSRVLYYTPDMDLAVAE